MRYRVTSYALVLVLPVVSAACFHRLIASPGSLLVDSRRASIDYADRGHVRGIGNDLTTVFLPRFCYVVGQSRLNGKRPLWDSTGFGGRPLVGNPQAGLFYPAVWVAWWSGRPESLGWLTAAHLLWAGLGVFVLTQSLGFGRLASAVAGGCFQASPYLIAHTFEGHYPHVWSACWYPWAFWGVLLVRRQRALGYWVLPAVLALTFLTGHPQEWYYLVLALTAWVVADAWLSVRAGAAGEGLRRALVWAGLFGLSLCLCAVELLPELAVRPWLLRSSAIPLTLVNRYQVHLANLLQLLSPFALGRPQDYVGHDNYWETVLSIGLAPLALAVLGAVRYEDREIIRGWGVVVVASVVFAAGRRLGLYAIAYTLLPGMERFRVPSRTLFLASLGASVLAGAGAQGMLDRPITLPQNLSRKIRQGASLMAAVALIAVMLVCRGLAPGIAVREKVNRCSDGEVWAPKSVIERDSRRKGAGFTYVARDQIFWGTLLGMSAVFAYGVDRKHGGLLSAGGLGALGLFELSLSAQSLLVCAPVSSFVGGQEIRANLERSKDEPSGPVRVSTVGTLLSDLGAASADLEKTNVNDGFQIQHSADLYERLYPLLEAYGPGQRGYLPMDLAVEQHKGEIAQAVMDLMSVRYLVADRPLPLSGFTRVEGKSPRKSSAAVWANRTAVPRAYVVPRALTHRGKVSDGIPAKLRGFDPSRGVLMPRDPLSGDDRQPFTPAEWRSHDPDLVTIRVETSAAGLLVVGNTWMPGWTASVDSAPAPVLMGNYWQQVVPLPERGRHEIVLRYQPPGLALGLGITQAALAVWGGSGLILLLRLVLRGAWNAMAWRLEGALTPSRVVSGRTTRASAGW